MESAGLAVEACDPNICRHWRTHIAIAQISSTTANRPKNARPIISPGMNPKPPMLPVNLRSPGPKATQSKVTAKHVITRVASKFRHFVYSGGKAIRIPAKTNINPAGTAIKRSAVKGSAWAAP
jgi:hypothetical protein